MLHIPYDLVTLEGGKISSREGDLIYADDLVNGVIDFALKEVRKRHKDWDEKRIQQSARNIALSSIKFGMLNHDNNKPIVFNPEKALDFEGETGPYVQYAHARICSIFRKHGKDIDYDIDYSLLNKDEEIKLIALSVHDEPSVHRSAVAAGCDGFVLKRTIAEELLPVVERLLPRPRGA